VTNEDAASSAKRKMHTITSDLTATVWKIAVAVGDEVREGDELVVLESMKMEIPVEADRDGRIAAIHVACGESVIDGSPIVTIA
jgi:acetyl-CoA carboxylase biotin carboxyl carrier protein